MATKANPERPVRIWDAPTRLFHWLLALLVGAAYLSQELGHIDRHMTIGYVILTLVLFRVLWGFAGSEPSRFASFVPGPRGVIGYLRALLAGRPPKTPGHNPVGALLIFAMLALVAFQASTGLFANDDIFSEGPLAKLVDKDTSDWLTQMHETSFWILLGLVGVHVTANLGYELVLKQPVVRAMVSGSKPLPEAVRAPRLRSPWLALPVLAVAAVTVWYIVTRL